MAVGEKRVQILCLETGEIVQVTVSSTQDPARPGLDPSVVVTDFAARDPETASGKGAGKAGALGRDRASDQRAARAGCEC